MKRVSWSEDVVDIVRIPPPRPQISVGTVLAYLAQNGVSEETCIESISTRGNIFKNAAHVAPYCTHPAIAKAKGIFDAVSFPFKDAEAPLHISNISTLHELNNYIDIHAIIKDRILVYKWMLAYTRLDMYLTRMLIQFTRPHRCRPILKKHVIPSS